MKKFIRIILLILLCCIITLLSAILMGRIGIIDIPWIDSKNHYPPKEYEYIFKYIDINGEIKDTVYINKNKLTRIHGYKNENHEYSNKKIKTLTEDESKVLKTLIRCMYEDEVSLKRWGTVYTTPDNHWEYKGEKGNILVLKPEEENLIKIIY